MSVIAIAIPTVTPRLAKCAAHAISRTTDESIRLLVVKGQAHGEALTTAMKKAPAETEWFLTMDDDAAPLRRGWLPWIIAKADAHGGSAGFWPSRHGYPHPLGACYSMKWLRSWHLPTFHAIGIWDVGEYLGAAMNPMPFIAKKADPRTLPWWLHGCDVAADDEGRPIFAHLGGGTIGHTWLHRGRLYPRIPTWLWPIMVRRYLARLS